MVVTGDGMGVIETNPCRLEDKGDLAHTLGWHEWRAFLRSSVDLARYSLSMPVDQLRCIRIIINVDYDSLPFLEAHERPRELAIVFAAMHSYVRKMPSDDGCDHAGRYAFTVLCVQKARSASI